MYKTLAKNSAVRAIYRSVYGVLDRISISRLSDTRDPHRQKFVNVLEKFAAANRDVVQGPTAKIEKIRQRLLQRDDLLDDGTLPTPGPYDNKLTVREVCMVSKPPRSALFLHCLVHEFQPANCIELGTNVGISSACIATALHNGQLTTFEASPYRIRIAQGIHAELGLNNIRYVQGLFADTLEESLQNVKEIDFAFIDGHHQYQPTLDYFHLIREHTTQDSLVLFDDIRWSSGMKRAWQEIQADPRVSLALDFQTMGVCIVGREAIQEERATNAIRVRSLLY